MVAVVVLADAGDELLGQRVEGRFELLHDVLEDGVGHVVDEEVLLQVGVGQGGIIQGFRNRDGRGRGPDGWLRGRCSGFQEPFLPLFGRFDCLVATKLRVLG